MVAIDPAPCLGDPAFDTVDLLFWRAEDVETIATRAEQLAPAVGADDKRLLNWCAAFAAMVALEIAEAPDGSPRTGRTPYGARLTRLETPLSACPSNRARRPRAKALGTAKKAGRRGIEPAQDFNRTAVLPARHLDFPQPMRVASRRCDVVF